ncbi:tRNA uridine-5-carboxymethylaminomethyl(34) synthesis GTPase MnmE [Nitratifractor sp.]|uniref:tRNA uridine-5-carboxymethylaminomethyl(34) synthesis GTPase MnmE n=1 Tax=Nitratifractor sp. TaxID=2268144 RepID=UPI0025DEABBA|nr:tRNA uridine-5-carboxymethylaminomethyl(34) synthesis GTPase MnmE [Nitratifractor sp.]
MSETIAAIATAHGVASISIVRLSGPDALSIARRIAPHASLEPRYAQLQTLFDASGEVIDRGLVLRFQAPRSFTGEEVVEFQCHGGQIVAQEILEAALHHGARLAEPGEFSKRAFLNGKIDLSEAEAIAKLIEARSVDAARILARQVRGELGRFVDEAREALLRALAHSEVMIDYAEEDLPEDLVAKLQEQLTELSERLKRIVESSERRRGLIEGFRVAIVGKPNVGKSSLLNALLSYERAIVSDVAGTTRDTIEEEIRIGTHILRIVDTAGIREAGDRIEAIGVERSLRSVEEADIVLALFDRSRPWDAEDEAILEMLRNSGKEWIAVLNKCDLPTRMATEKLAPYEPVEIDTRKNFSALPERLKAFLDRYNVDEELMLSSRRQIEAVREAQQAIAEALPPLHAGELELFSYRLQEAATALGKITHPYESEEILDRMFGEFCLGK